MSHRRTLPTNVDIRSLYLCLAMESRFPGETIITQNENKTELRDIMRKFYNTYLITVNFKIWEWAIYGFSLCLSLFLDFAIAFIKFDFLKESYFSRVKGIYYPLDNLKWVKIKRLCPWYFYFQGPSLPWLETGMWLGFWSITSSVLPVFKTTKQFVKDWSYRER